MLQPPSLEDAAQRYGGVFERNPAPHASAAQGALKEKLSTLLRHTLL
jgi:hypothetical protein